MKLAITTFYHPSYLESTDASGTQIIRYFIQSGDEMVEVPWIGAMIESHGHITPPAVDAVFNRKVDDR